MEYKDYYKVLGVDKNATADQIKKQYRKLAVKYHPDKNPGDKTAEERFKEISEAYQVIGNAESRKKYDELGSNWKQYENGGFQNQSGRNSGFSGFSSGEDFSEGNFSDFFEMFFGGRGDSPFNDFDLRGSGRRRSSRASRGNDVEATLNLTLLEAYQGSQRLLNIGNETLKINIKPGVKNGQVLRVKGKGAPGNNGGENGDVLLHVVVLNSTDYQRDGDDLIKNISIDFYTAILGGKITVETLKGAINVPIKPNTQQGATLRLKGMGMPHYDRDGAGNMLLRIQIVLPDRISDKERDLIAKANDIRMKKV